MKPLKLKISGFGPYGAPQEEINFEEMGNLFLIAGDTGAGKTTIFDAICFALYGKASGTFRDSKNMRSDFSGPETETYVEFFFEHGGEKYKVYRSPKYEREKKRGKGTIVVPEKAALFPENEKPIEGVNAVSKRLVEILNVDFSQFKQISMIAQGEFLELLNAGTIKRAEILQRIFLTDGYKKMEYILKGKKDRAYGAIKESEKSIRQYFDGARVPDDMKDDYELIKQNDFCDIDEMISFLDKLIAAQDVELSQIVDSLKAEEEKLKTNQETLTIAETANETITNLEKAKTELNSVQEKEDEYIEKSKQLKRKKLFTKDISPELESRAQVRKKLKILEDTIKKDEENLSRSSSEVKTIDAKIKGIKEQENEDVKRKETLISIRDSLAEYEEKDKAKEKLLSTQKLLASTNEAFTKKEQELNTLKAQIEKWEAELNSVQEERISFERKKAELEKLSSRETTISDLITKGTEWKDNYNKVASLQRKFQEADKKFKAAKTEYDQSESLFEKYQIGILGSALEENTPCPVCGSIHHPNPAKIPVKTDITKADIDLLKERMEELRAKKDALFVETSSAYSTTKNDTKNLVEAFSEYVRIDNVQESTSISKQGKMLWETVGKLKEYKLKIQEAIAKYVSEVDAFKEKENKSKVLLENVQNGRTVLLKDLEKELEGMREKLSTLKISASVLEPKAKKKLPYNDKESALKAMGVLEKEIEAYSNKAKELSAAMEKALMELAKNKETLALHMDQRKELRIENERTQKAIENILIKHGMKDEDEIMKYIIDDTAADALEKEIRDYANILQVAKVTVEQLSKAAKDIKVTDISSLRDMVKKLEEAVLATRHIHNTIQHNNETNKEILKNIKVVQEKSNDNMKLWGTYTKLYNLVSGQVNGKKKITLEQYVQMSGYDNVIRAANARLLPMSDGQFELCRRETSNLKSSSVLDLDVIDNFTGKTRPVNTLSGGESFKASLCLALGLSDAISANHGGIATDMLFIDEGFGALDSHSIENAMDVLISLSDSTKLIGLISHREELKDRIQNQIIVTRTKNGSNIKTVTSV